MLQYLTQKTQPQISWKETRNLQKIHSLCRSILQEMFCENTYIRKKVFFCTVRGLDLQFYKKESHLRNFPVIIAILQKGCSWISELALHLSCNLCKVITIFY